MITNLTDFLALNEEVTPSEESRIKKKLPWVKVVSDKTEDDTSASFIDLSKCKARTNSEYLEIMKTNKTAGQNTFIFPVSDWSMKTDEHYVHTMTNCNPIAAIYVALTHNPNKFKKDFKGCRFIFCSEDGFFDFNADNVTNEYAAKFDTSIKSMYSSKNVHGKNLLGDNGKPVKKSKEEVKEVNPVKPVEDKKTKQEIRDEKNNQIADLINDIAANSESEEEALAKMEEDEELIRLVAELDEVDGVNMNAARSTRMKKLNDNFVKSEFKGKTVSSIVNDRATKELPVTSLPVDSINEEWNELKFVNFQNAYDVNDDIIKIIYFLTTRSYPIAIRNVDIEDTSTVMDYINTYRVECEDAFGKRFTLTFDIPQFVNNRFMRLGGNDKTISGQLPLLPCIKTDNDTTQIVTNYNKVFIRRYGSVGRSLIETDKLLKTLKKLKNNTKTKIKIVEGDNSNICTKYELPIDYIDIASNYSRITLGGDTFIFDQDYIRNNYNINTDELALGIQTLENGTERIIYLPDDDDYTKYNVSKFVAWYLMKDEEFASIYNATKPANKMMYAKASILNTEIPVVVICGYLKGLDSVLSKLKIYNEFTTEKVCSKPGDYDTIRFEDGYLHYQTTYESSLIMNGLKECDTINYSYAEVNSKRMWLDFLDNYGGRILSDGIENYADLLIDPITAEVCEECRTPTEFDEILIYGSNLLVDNKYNRHVDISGNRYRTNEIIAGYTYKAISKAYGEYRTSNKKGRRVPMQMKRSAVIDLIMADPVSGDLSTMSALSENEAANTVSFKGLAGMNVDRAYGLDKRTYDDSMINKLALSTGFAANVGINRQVTIDMSVNSNRGYIKNNSDTNDMSITKSFCMTEALTPFGTTRDDPFRSAMTFIQTSKHTMRTKASGPLLITNGADEALAHMCSDVFSFKAKQDGEVVELVEGKYMVISYKDGTSDYIDLTEQVKKNSDGGIYVTLRLVPDMKLKQKFKAGDIVAHDPQSFSKTMGATDNLAYSIGTLAKVALPVTDAGYEDSTEVDEWLSEAMASDVVVEREITLPPDTNVYMLVKEGQPIQEGEPLILFQNAFEEKDANLLLKAITDEDAVSDLGRIRIKSKYTGVVEKVKLYRTAPIDTYSESLQKIIKAYEKDIKATKAIYKKHNIPGANKLEPDYELPATGKLKDVGNGVKIVVYIKYEDKLSVGDKIVGQSAAKGVIKDVYAKGKEPYSEFRPEEKIHALFSVASYNARMITSVFVSGAINKAMIELDRSVKEIMGIKSKSIDDIQMNRKE